MYADKINDQQSIVCQTKNDKYSTEPYAFRISFRGDANDYVDIDAADSAQFIRTKLRELATIDDVAVTLAPVGRVTACSKAGDTRIVVTFNHTNQGGDLPLLDVTKIPGLRDIEVLTIAKVQAGYGAPTMSLIDATMVGNVALGEFGRGGGMYANDGVVRHMNSRVTQNKAASGGGLFMGKAGLFELIELANCGVTDDPDSPPCSSELLIQSNEACRVDQGYDSCAVHKATPLRQMDGTMSAPACPSVICPSLTKEADCIRAAHCEYNSGAQQCFTYIQTPMAFATWSDDKACAARISGRGLFRGGNINVEGDVTLDGMSITHGRAEVGGAVFISDHSKSTLSRCSIMYNRAMDKGGAIYFGYQADVDLVEMTISHNHAKLGGGLFLDRCQGTHFNLNVTMNTAAEAGGGIYVMQGTVFKGSNSTLGANSIAPQEDETNVVPIGGAGIYINGQGFEIAGLDVVESVSEKGGGIFVESESAGVLTHMRLAYNTATESQGGGGIFISSNSNITFEHSLIEENNAADGGGMAINSADVYLKKVTFFNNTARGNGGGIIVKGEQAHVLIDRSTFDSNQAISGDGGGVALTDSVKATVPPVANIVSSMFRNNEALSGNGGNIMVAKSMVLHIENSVVACRGIWKNGDGQVMLGALQATAINGGGFYFGIGTNGTLKSTSVRGCKAEAGGGLYAVESQNVQISDQTVFQYNVGDFGGAISVSLKANLVVRDVVLKENRANYDGGAIHVEDTSVEIQDVMILGNKADSRGGGLFVDKRGRLDGTNLQIIENYAEGEGGGMYMGWGATSTMKACRFGSNIARASGGAVYTSSKDGLYLIGSNIVVPKLMSSKENSAKASTTSATSATSTTSTTSTANGGSTRRRLQYQQRYLMATDEATRMELLRAKVELFRKEGNQSFDMVPAVVSPSFETSYLHSWKTTNQHVFVEINAGRCDDVPDRNYIYNRSMCVEGAASLAWDNTNGGATSTWEGDINPKPGCYRQDGGELHWNDPNVTSHYNNQATVPTRIKLGLFTDDEHKFDTDFITPDHFSSKSYGIGPRKVGQESKEDPFKEDYHRYTLYSTAYRGALCSKDITCVCVLDHVDDNLRHNMRKSTSTGTHDQQVLSDCMFWNNTVDDPQSETTGGGGAVAVAVGGVVDVHSCDFYRNRAAKGKGGAFYVDGNQASMTMSNSTMRYNTAIHGGALFLDRVSKGLLYQTDVWGNTATDEGGGFHLDGPSSLTIRFGNVLDNSAGKAKRHCCHLCSVCHVGMCGRRNFM